MLQIQAQFVECVSAVYCRYRHCLLQIQAQFGRSSPHVLSSLRVRHPIRFRSQPNQIPSATQSDSVRYPIRFRPPPVGGYGILPYPRSPHRGCSGLRCTNQAINQPSNQPTKQSNTKPNTKQTPNQQTILILPIKSSHISNKNTNFANP